MKLLKITDSVVQVLITLYFIISSLLMHDSGQMMYWYFILGGWQVLSYLLHQFSGWPMLNKKERNNYGSCLGWILFLGLILYLLLLIELPILIFYLFAMLFVGPVMAIWYFTIGYREYVQIRHREFIHLK